ncbi:N-acetylmuramoyl-L-alanine amidase [Antarcticibacterium flavum]|uniref:N-acetylmuramoyl-L-alanine amidase n=1 Tax=Antarcticibacterium flavum TaxID=2058175 RepID=A0A5B7X2D2_9FLAO|nr:MULTISPECIES: N-acetylmuramoyl-L-alanine amidase [Antarcticibacterium]MCM4160102.1 N-acetylmuramoyl-L-alanine amidase [Antarcticibacterium sp. W02-3]QCY69656.1 N-acetylmuramoyl-L-alanine amidase [Antarcticibacterium flavum]
MIKIARFLTLVLLIHTAISCGSNPYATTNKQHQDQSRQLTRQLNTFPPDRTPAEAGLKHAEDWVGTTNFNLRKPNFVIIHHTEQDSVAQTLYTFTLRRTQVSSHYVISRDGDIYQMLNDHYRAWHAGVGKWGNVTDLNSSSIGIELDNNGFEEFTPAMLNSLLELLQVLKEKHKIPTANFIGHSDIAPGRKVDPNPTFPWELLAKEGFGLWYDDLDEEEPVVVIDGRPAVRRWNPDSKNGTTLVEAVEDSLQSQFIDVDPEIALRIIGYDTSNLEAAIQSFKLHFIQTEVNSDLTARDLKILNNLYKKYM